jgi:hypothetical protein
MKLQTTAMKKILSLFILLLPAGLLAQDSYYYHTIHSNSLAAMFGRTYKVHYAYQLSHLRQFKFSGVYVSDEYSQSDGNRIEVKTYAGALQFQYNLIHFGKVFLNAGAGFGVHFLEAEDLIGIKFDEWNLNFAGGVQGEYYLQSNRLALLVDYDIFFMPFSDIYEFLHVPTVGLAVFF